MRKLLLVIFAVLTLIPSLETAAQEDGNAPRRRRNFFNPEYPNVHDPVMAYENGRYYVFHTGMGVAVMSSADLKTWRRENNVFTMPPEWAVDSVKGYFGHTWAPDIIRGNDGLWHLYYSCSTFGKNRSVIGEAVNRTLDPESPLFKWEDKGMVVESKPGGTNYNAIDPGVVIDGKNRTWMTFGSFWGGIQLVQLSSDMHTPKGKTTVVARRKAPRKKNGSSKPYPQEPRDNSVEAPFIFYHDGYFYLLVSFDYCCRGINSNYKVAVGRSKKVVGPYKDKDGRRLDQGGGTILCQTDSLYAGIGHCAAYQFENDPQKEWLFVAHGYDKNLKGASKLVLRKMDFEDGWPVLRE